MKCLKSGKYNITTHGRKRHRRLPKCPLFRCAHEEIMSVICQNFVQNAWKKDLCSNCFKSFSDHVSPCLITRTEAEENEKNVVLSQLNGNRYISQATTIYQSRGLLCHSSWKALIGTESTAYVLDNSINKVSPPQVNGDYRQQLLMNGSTTPTTNGHDTRNGEVRGGILKVTPASKTNNNFRKSNVVFKEDEALVIGYGGNDYDSDDSFEMNSDDDISLESLDFTEEDRAITKITKENTDFNSINDNLLCPPPPSARQQPQQQKAPTTATESPVVPAPHPEGAKNIPRAESSSEDSKYSDSSPSSNVSSLAKEKDKEQQPTTPTAHNEAGALAACAANVVTTSSAEESAVPEKEDAVVSGHVNSVSSVAVMQQVVSSSVAEKNNEYLVHSSSTTTSVIHEARSSFLYSITSTPSAIYTPGKDLFVHRESSSEEDVSVAQDVPPTTPISHSPSSPVKPKVPAKPAHIISQAQMSPKRETSPPPLLRSEPLPPAHDDDGPLYAVSDKLCLPQNENTNIYYADSTIYQEIEFRRNTATSSSTNVLTESEEASRKEQKLAQLAAQLEQARYSTVAKRQAPAPPVNPDESAYSNYSSPRKASTNGHSGSSKQKSSSQKHYAHGSISGKSKISNKAKTNSYSLNTDVSEDCAKSNKRSLFSLKKLLRRGSKDNVDAEEISHTRNNGQMTPNPKAWKNNEFDKSKLRLEIIHPMDLVKSSSETASDSGSGSGTPPPPSSCTMTPVADSELHEGNFPRLSEQTAASQRETQAESSSTGHDVSIESRISPDPCSPPQGPSPFKGSRPVRPPKPPPPPRIKSPLASPTKSQTKEDPGPLPPKPAVPKRLYRPSMRSDYANLVDSVCDWFSRNVFKKLGDIRTPMAPKKPQRANSLPSCTSEKQGVSGGLDETVYEFIKGGEDDGFYYGPDYQNTSFQHDTHVPLETMQLAGCAKDDEPVTAAGGGEEPPSSPLKHTCLGTFNIQDQWPSIEKSFSMVTVSNYESLAQLLEHIISCRCSFLTKKRDADLSWNDFVINESTPKHNIQIYQGAYLEDMVKVTLLVVNKLTPNPVMTSLLKSRFFTHFHYPDMDATVVVLPHGTIDTLTTSNVHGDSQHIAFILIQIITILKAIQAGGIEEVPPSLDNIILSKWDHLSTVLFLSANHPSSSSSATNEKQVASNISLCQYVLRVLLHLQKTSSPETIISNSTGKSKIFAILVNVLREEKASTLSQAKNLLEYFLWGPGELLRENWPPDFDSNLHRWLEIQRAEALKMCIGKLQSGQLLQSVFLEYYLSFLVNSASKSLKEISFLLDSKGYFKEGVLCDSEELYQDRLLTPL